MLDTLVKELQLVSGTNKKIVILSRAQYCNCPIIKEALRLTYDPNIKFNINKILKPHKSGSTSFSDAFEDFKILAAMLISGGLSGNSARETLNNFLEDCISSVQDVYIKIIKKDLKIGISHNTLCKVFGKDFITVFEVQLANKYDANKNYDVDIWWASPKLDGIRCYFKDGNLHTRNGKILVGFNHIIAELKQIENAGNLTFIDGELFSDNRVFESLQGTIMSNKNMNETEKKNIKYNVFAMGHPDIHNTQHMVIKINTLIKNYKYIRPINYSQVTNNNDELDDLVNYMIERGFEGVMLRHPHIAYEHKRSDALLKMKLFIEDDFIVTGFISGEPGSKYEHTLGSLIVEGIIEGIEVKSMVGTGLSDDQRNDIWKHQTELLNKKVEIKYQNLTASTSGKCSLRFPVFLKFKLDR